METIIAVVASFIFVGGVVIYVATDLFSTLVGIGLVLLGATIGFLIFWIRHRIQKKRDEIWNSDCISVNEEDKIITISKRAPICSKYISISRFKYNRTQYHDAELVYTGVTVGGVHTGGYHVNPAGSSKGELVVTDKYDLYLQPYDIRLDKIKLTDQALLDAQNTPFLSQFLRENGTLELYHPVNPQSLSYGAWKPYLDSSASATDKTVNNYHMTKIVTESKLTKEECEQIRDWLGGNQT